MKKILIIDALNMFFRCYARDPSIATNGNPAGGCVGFLKSLQKSMRLTQPDDVVIVWDGSGGSRRRRQINKDYKMGRKVVHLPKDMNYNFSQEEEMDNKVWQQTRLLEYLDNLPICQFMFDEVEADDVSEAVRLIKVATQSAATDPVTGQIDMDMLAIGITTDTRKKINDLVEKIREILVRNLFWILNFGLFLVCLGGVETYKAKDN